MHKTDLTQFDIKPEAMVNYLRYNGPHFNKKLLQFAVKKMTRRGVDGKETPIVPYSVEQVDNIIRVNGINLEYNQLYDYVFVANMCKADYLGSSITDETHLAKYIKDVIDDVDGYDGIAFNRWYSDMCRKGIVINWEEMI